MRSGRTINGYSVVVRRAPEPLDIIWENLGGSEFFKKWIRLISWIFVLFLIMTSFFVISNIKKHQQVKAFKDVKTGIFSFIIDIMLALLISITNLIIGLIVWYAAIYERYSTYTSFETSLATRIAFFQFLNSTLSLIMVNFWLNGSKIGTQIWSNTGLLNDA